jgi:hypothetical protein
VAKCHAGARYTSGHWIGFACSKRALPDGMYCAECKEVAMERVRLMKGGAKGSYWSGYTRGSRVGMRRNMGMGDW